MKFIPFNIRQSIILWLIVSAMNFQPVRAAGYSVFDKKPKPPLGSKANAAQSAHEPEILLAFDELKNGSTPDTGKLRTSVDLKGAALVAGKIGKALDFNGETDHATIDTDLNLTTSDAYTIAVWVQPHSQVNYGVIFNSGGSRGISFRLQGARIDLNTGFEWHILNAPIPNEEWTHVAATYDGTTATLYVNGKLVGEKQVGYRIQYGKQIFIGQVAEMLNSDGGDKKVEQPSQFLKASIDDLRFYSVVLTNEEIESIAKQP